MAQRNSDIPEFTQGFWKHGRFYGDWRRDKYQFPIDKEETNRYDIFHKFFLLARHEEAFSYPINKPNPRVLDLGTGTGIWAINVAEDYLKNAHIMAVDLNRIQPALIPRNMQTIQFDLEEASWEPLLKDCDLIHMRLLLGSIHNNLWAATYRKAFEHTAPGGYIEQVEMNWLPSWEGTDIPAHSSFLEWAQKFLQGMDGFQRSARVSTGNVRAMMEAAGYVNFEERTIRCYVNPWCSDPGEKRVAQWFNLCLIDGVQAMSLAPMVENLGMSIEQVNELREAVKSECCKLRYHAYCVMHIWTARRPTR
ncbi:methyl transferase [Cordyceps javanica]|nr:methyl transferase [Cordyceps javanica]